MKIRKTLVATALLALLAVAAVIVAGAVVPGAAPQAQAADPVVLTVTGNGQSKTFTMAELKALPVVLRLLRLREQRRHRLSARSRSPASGSATCSLRSAA